MLARGTASDPEFQIAQAVANDDWDRWNEDRDRQLEESQSYNHVSRDIYGAEDLDRYGTWQNDPSYGETWYPRVADDWAPYRDGRWSWVDWYGWSWVSYDPWGWAPYHYGRWYHNPSRGWGWWPGDRYGRHYWSPGWWLSWAGIAGAGVVRAWGSEGSAGSPWPRMSVTIRGTETANTRDTATAATTETAWAWSTTSTSTAVIGTRHPQCDYRRGWPGLRQRPQGFRGPMNDGRLGRASLVRGALPVTPGRESLRLSDRAVRMNSLPQSRSDTRFVSRQQPARVDRVPFEDQRRGMDQMARRTFGDQRSPAVNTGGPAGRNQGTSVSNAGPLHEQPGVASGRRRRSGGEPESASSASQRVAAGSRGLRGFRARRRRDAPEPASGGNLRTPQSSQPNLQGGGMSRNSRDGWSRFGTGSGTTGRDLGSGNSSPRSVDRGQNYPGNGGSVAPRSASPRYESPRTSSPQTYRGGGQAQVRINPPIVRERAPSYGGGGTYSRPAPSYRAAAATAGQPRVTAAAAATAGRPRVPAAAATAARRRVAAAAATAGQPRVPAAVAATAGRRRARGGGSYSRSAPSSGGGGSYSRSAPSSAAAATTAGRRRVPAAAATTAGRPRAAAAVTAGRPPSSGRGPQQRRWRRQDAKRPFPVRASV